LRQHWGGRTNGEITALMLGHALETTEMPHVWFHIAPDNIRAQKATVKIGADYVGKDALMLSGRLSPMTSCRIRRDVRLERLAIGG
jgi:RimJ/RimL family protein N-acetyltransferase